MGSSCTVPSKCTLELGIEQGTVGIGQHKEIWPKTTKREGSKSISIRIIFIISVCPNIGTYPHKGKRKTETTETSYLFSIS
jgi:hypothetical protein